MEARNRGNWIDTEGSTTSIFRKSGRSSGSFRRGIHVAQTESAPLEAYAMGALHDGVACFLYTNTANGATRAYIQGIRNVGREVRLTCDYIRTANEWRQIERFYELVAATRRRRGILDGHRIR